MGQSENWPSGQVFLPVLSLRIKVQRIGIGPYNPCKTLVESGAEFTWLRLQAFFSV
jgi:hypothetical protein